MNNKTSIETLGQRMKLYENVETGRCLMPLLPACARLDGRAFHTFCRGMDRPFDIKMVEAMAQTAKDLLAETDACIAYTQSDEITLLWHSTDIKSQIFMAGRIFKMCSLLASAASIRFWLNMPDEWKNKKKPPTFDCRIWNVPNREEACNLLLWRERDATRNSILSAGQAHFSHKQLNGKNTSDIQEMLHGIGKNWNDYPSFFKRGIYFRRVVVETPFSAEELEKLPERHEARKNPGLIVRRHVLLREELPAFGTIVNKEAVVFESAKPIVESGG